MELRKASRKRSKLRIGLFGASGSGKTMGALKMAYGITKDWTKIALIDTERGSGELYSHLGDYNTLPLEAPFEPERYINAIGTCERAGMEVIIIDSISHEWIGKGGCLEIVERVQARNDYAKWKDVTPRHNAFIDKILQTNAHVICCGRSKDDVVLQQNDKGKMVPQKVGLKAVTRDGFDFEMTLCFDLDAFHLAHCTKDRTQLFDGKPSFQVSEETGAAIMEWMEGGEEVVGPQLDDAAAIELMQTSIRTAIANGEINKEKAMEIAGVPTLQGLTLDALSTVYNSIMDYIRINQAQKEHAA